MSKKITDFTEIQLREIFSKAGLNSQEVDKAVADYIRYRESEISSLSILSYRDIKAIGGEALISLLENVKDSTDLVEEILTHYRYYLRDKKRIAEAYLQANSWRDVVASDGFNSDTGEGMEAFVDYVEEVYQTKVKDAKHLEKLTGLTDEDFKREPNIRPGAEATFQSILTRSGYSRYFRKLQRAVNEGAKYKDLLQIKPQDYGLPKSWSGELGSDQYSSILWAISFEFLIAEGNGFLMLTPSLRAIAKDLDAPYSVLMDCYNLTNKGKKYGATGN